MTSSLRLLAECAESLLDCGRGREAEILNIVIEHLRGGNRKLREVADQFLTHFCSALSKHIAEQADDPHARELLGFLTRKIKATVQQAEEPQTLISFIKAHGAFARAIRALHSEPALHDTLYFLIENSQASLFNRIDKLENFNFEKNPKNFKAVLFNQKQLVSYLSAFAFIFVELDNLLPNEINFLTKIIELSIKYLINFFPPYQKALCDNFSLMLNSLPQINYLAFIFRTYLHSLLDSMAANLSLLDADGFRLYLFFFERSLASRLSHEKVALVFDQLLYLLTELAEKSEVKSCSLAVLEQTKPHSALAFHFLVQLFTEVLRNHTLAAHLVSCEKNLLNLFVVLDKRVQASVKNFLFLRLLSLLALLDGVQAFLHANDKARHSFFLTLEKTLHAKSKFQEPFELAAFAEFVARAALCLCALHKVSPLPEKLVAVFAPKFLEELDLFLAASAPHNSLAFLFIDAFRVFCDADFARAFDQTFRLSARLIRLISARSAAEQPQRNKAHFLYHNDFEKNTDHLLQRIFATIQTALFSAAKEQRPLALAHHALLRSAAVRRVRWEFLISVLLDHDKPAAASAPDHLFMSLCQVFQRDLAESQTALDPAALELLNRLVLLIFDKATSHPHQLSANPEQLLQTLANLLLISVQNCPQQAKSELKIFPALVRHISFRSSQGANAMAPKAIDSQLASHLFSLCLFSMSEPLCRDVKQSLFQEVNTALLTEQLQTSYFVCELLNGLIEIRFLNLEVEADFAEVYACLLRLFANQALFRNPSDEDLNSLRLVLQSLVAQLEKNKSAAVALPPCFALRHTLPLVLPNFFTLLVRLLALAVDFPALLAAEKKREAIDHAHFLFALVDALTDARDSALLDIICSIVALSKHDVELIVFACCEFRRTVAVEKLLALRAAETSAALLGHDAPSQLQVQLVKDLCHALPALDGATHFVAGLFDQIFPRGFSLFEDASTLQAFKFRMDTVFHFSKACPTATAHLLARVHSLSLYAMLEDILEKRRTGFWLALKGKYLFSLLLKLGCVSPQFVLALVAKRDFQPEFFSAFTAALKKLADDRVVALLATVLEYCSATDSFEGVAVLLDLLKAQNKKELPFAAPLPLPCSAAHFSEHFDETIAVLLKFTSLGLALPQPLLAEVFARVLAEVPRQPDYDYLQLLEFVSRVVDSRELVVAFIATAKPALQQAIFRAVPAGLLALPKSAPEHEHFCALVDVVFAIAARWQCLDYLSLVAFLLSDSRSVFIEKIAGETEELCKTLTPSADTELFVAKWLAEAVTLEQGSEFKSLFVQWDCVVRRLTLALAQAARVELLAGFFEKLIAGLEAGDDSARSPLEMQTLVCQKQLLCAVTELVFEHVAAGELYEKVYTRLRAGSHQEATRRICMALTDILSGAASQSAKFGDRLRHAAQAVMDAEHELRVFKAALNATCAAAFNCLAVVLLNTQSKPSPFVNFLIFSKASKLVLEWICPEHSHYDFKVVTEFPTKELTRESKFFAPFAQYSIDLLTAVDPTLPDKKPVSEKLLFENLGSVSIEIDDVGAHPCFAHFARVVCFLIGAPADSEWVDRLAGALASPRTWLTVKLFVLKTLLTFCAYFKLHRWKFLEGVLQYLGAAENGGKGLHYFYRDVTQLFVLWFGDDAECVGPPPTALLDRFLKTLLSKLGDFSTVVFQQNIELFRRVVRAAKQWGHGFDVEPALRLLALESPDANSNAWRLAGLEAVAVFLREDVSVRAAGDALSIADPKNFPLREKLLRLLFNLLQLNSKMVIKTVGIVIGRVLNANRAKEIDSGLRRLCLDKIVQLNARLSEKFFLFLRNLFSLNNSLYFDNPVLRREVLSTLNKARDKNALHLIKTLTEVVTAEKSVLDEERLALLTQDVAEVALVTLARAPKASAVELVAALCKAFWEKHRVAGEAAMLKTAQALSECLALSRAALDPLVGFVEEAAAQLTPTTATPITLIVLNCLKTGVDECSRDRLLHVLEERLDRKHLIDKLQLVYHAKNACDSLNLIAAFLLSEVNTKVQGAAHACVAPPLSLESLKSKVLAALRRTAKREENEENEGILTFTTHKSLLGLAQDKQVFKLFSETLRDEPVDQLIDPEGAPADTETASEYALTQPVATAAPVVVTTTSANFMRFTKDFIEPLPSCIRRRYEQILHRSDSTLESARGDVSSALLRRVARGDQFGLALFTELMLRAYQSFRPVQRQTAVKLLCHVLGKAESGEAVARSKVQDLLYLLLNFDAPNVYATLAAHTDKLDDEHLRMLVCEAKVLNAVSLPEHTARRVNLNPSRTLDLDVLAGAITEKTLPPLLDLSQSYLKLECRNSLAVVFGAEERSTVLDLKLAKRLRAFLRESDIAPKTPLVSTILKKERQEAFALLMDWSDLLQCTVESYERERECAVSRDAGGLKINSFARLDRADQAYLMQALVCSKDLWDVWRENAPELLQNVAEKTLLEQRFPSELAFFALANYEFDKAAYYNELLREQLKRDLERGQLSGEKIASITAYNDVWNFLHLNRTAPLLPSTEQLESAARLLAVSPEKSAHFSVPALYYEFHLKDLLFSLIALNYKEVASTVVAEQTARNGLALSELLLQRNEFESAENVLRTVALAEETFRRSEDLAFELARLFSDLRKVALARDGESADRFESPQPDALSESAQLKLRFLRTDFRLFALQRSGREKSARLEQEVLEVNEEFRQLGAERLPAQMKREFLARLTETLRALLRLAGEHGAATPLLSAYFNNLQQSATAGNDIHGHLPFLFRLLRECPADARPLAAQLELPSQLFTAWIPQLICAEPFAPEFCLALLTRLAERSPELLAADVNFYQARRVCEQLARNGRLHAYIRFLHELESLNDPELKAVAILKSRSATMREELEAVLARKELHYANFERKFGAALRGGEEEPAALIARLEKAVKGKYAQVQTETLLSAFSAKLAAFNTYFGSQMVNFMGRKKVRLLGLHQKVTVINSLRKPKKLSLICEDGKTRSVLLKCGEDLRSDARIMSLFSLVNAFMSRPDLIFTYKVVAISADMGVIKWVSGSHSLKSLVERELEDGSVMETAAFAQRLAYINALPGTPTQRHLELYRRSDAEVVAEFETQARYFPAGTLRQSLRKLLGDAESFVRLRQKLLADYAVSCLAGYFLGVGDRHLDNLLVSLERQTLFAIDFGCAFNMGVRLAVPELVPFRLTQLLLDLGTPTLVQGDFKHAMVAALTTLKKHVQDFLDYVAVYTQEPLADWQRVEVDGGADALEFARSRIDVVRDKLSAKNPRLILLAELERSTALPPEFRAPVRDFVQRIDVARDKQVLDDLEFVQALIDLATYKAVLARTWLGWMPIV